MGCFLPFKRNHIQGFFRKRRFTVQPDKKPAVLRKFLTTRKYTVSLTSSIELPHTPLFSRTSISFPRKRNEVYSRNKLPFLSVGSGKFLTVILLVLELSRIMCNGYLLILLQYRRKALRPEKLIADILRHHIVQRFHKSQSLSYTWQRRSYHFHLTL